MCVRFIINLPQEDLSSVARICFQVEEAQWYYEDFIRPLDASLPPMSLRQFCLRIFQHCPLLSSFSEADQMAAFDAFLKYKERIPVRGAIMLNETMDSAVLVKGWKKGANWSFPRGKINKDEDDLDCAIRELWEETGYDVRAAGLPLDDDHLGEPLDVIMREQHLRFYVFRGVPMDTYFEPKTRKEISKVQWYKLSDLPGSRHQRNLQRQNGTSVNVNKFYMVAKFLPILEKWISKERSKQKMRNSGGQSVIVSYPEDVHTDDDIAQQYMSESAQETDSRAAPADLFSNVSGTEAALKALLKIQPQASDAYHNSTISSLEGAPNNKGNALMALLRPPAAQTQLPPQTPMDAIFNEAPIPKAPHHHHPRQTQPFTSMAPPPAFHIQQQQTNLPLHAYQPDHFRHPQTHQNSESQHYFPQHEQRGPPTSSFQYEHVRRSQPEQLRHPQPLPPQVQKAVFTGGLVQGSTFPQSMYVPEQSRPLQHHQSQHAIPPPQANVPNAQGPVTSVVAQAQPKLTSHTLALLNAFKTRDDDTSNGHDEMLRRFENQSLDPQELSADDTINSPQRSLADTGINMYCPPQGGSNITHFHRTDDHKSNLLGIFKSPQSALKQPAQPARPTQNTALLEMFRSSAPTATASAAPTPVKPVNMALLDLFNTPRLANNNAGAVPTELPISAQQFATVTGEDRGSPRSSIPAKALNDSQAPSPFRPVSILTRPHQEPVFMGDHPSNMPHYDTNRDDVSGQAGLSIQPSSRRVSAGKPSIFQPQILKRPQQDEVRPVELSSPNQGFPIPHNLPPVDRRSGQTAEQKQNLLSFFGKSAAVPLSPPYIQPKASTHPTERTVVDSTTRSRVGSLASNSRRGSHTPTSPADKGFLLGFLNNVAKGDGH